MRWLLGTLALMTATVALATTDEGEVLDRINAARIGAGTKPLVSSVPLQAVATDRLTTLAHRGNALHVPGDEVALSETASRFDVDATELAENVSIALEDADTIVNSWLGSASHRRNLLDPSFTQVGIAAQRVALDGKMANLVVTVFSDTGTPRLPAEEPLNNSKLPLALALLPVLALLLVATGRAAAQRR